jgi:hypothetical protein
MSYGQVVKCLLQHQDCFRKIVNIQAVRGLKLSFFVTVDPLNRNAVLGETLTVLFVLVVSCSLTKMAALTPPC